MGEGEPGPEDNWSVGVVTENADRFLRGLQLPTQRRPEGVGGDYDFPTDAGRLTSVALGSLQLKLTAWYTFLLAELGRQETELGALESTYEIALGLAMSAQQEGTDKRIVNDVLRARAMKGDSKLGRILKVIISHRARVKRLDVQGQIYHEQVSRLSREQSRRESEARVVG